jgi:electron transfer flavoprotein beta subunit
LLTVVGSANRPRPPSVRKAIANKLAATPLEYKMMLRQWPEFETEEDLETFLEARGLKIPVWTAEQIGAELERIGLDGSPTKVLKVDFVVLQSTESRQIEATEEGLKALMHELVEDYIL